MSTDREAAIRAWLIATLGRRDFELERASDDASFRRYLRLRVAGSPTRIVMDAPPATERLSTPVWLDLAARLRAAGLTVPEVFAQDLDQGLLLIGDLGTQQYLDVLDPNNVDALYGDALDALLRMQTRVADTQLPRLDEAWLRMELALMPEWFLQRHLGHALSDSDRDVLERTFRHLVESAQSQPQVFIHRDFHSRNLMRLDSGNPGILDFQGAMRGPLSYDLASLLRDCYIAWPPPRIDVWLEDYRLRLMRAAGIEVDPITFRRWFDLIGMQRHLKVLGLFCRLCYRDAKQRYLKDLPLVLRYVIAVARAYSEFDELAMLLERAISRRDITEPRHALDMTAS